MQLRAVIYERIFFAIWRKRDGEPDDGRQLSLVNSEQCGVVDCHRQSVGNWAPRRIQFSAVPRC